MKILDLFAGTGSFGLEALRRGATRVEFVERDARLCEELKSAVEQAKAGDRAAVHRGDVARVLGRLDGTFDVVFADPPYADTPFAQVAAELAGRELLADGAIVLFEHFRKTELPEALDGLALATRRIYGDTAVSVYRQATGRPAGRGA